MALANRFGFFDPQAPFNVTYGELPHWEQVGATYFITFRTADSLPSSVIKFWREERDDWLKRRKINPNQGNWGAALRKLPDDLQHAFHREFAYKLERALDDHRAGQCVLARSNLTRIVADALLHFDYDYLENVKANSRLRAKWLENSGTLDLPKPRYYLSDFVIMPNHVHVVVCFRKGTRLLSQCESWKHFTATKINRELGQSGAFWQPESFDHLVRNENQLSRFRKYIASNLSEAGMEPNEFNHYQSPHTDPTYKSFLPQPLGEN